MNFKITPYLGKDSYNILMKIIPITKNKCKIWLFPISKQVVYKDSKNRILYFGNKFDSFFEKEEEVKIQKKIKRFAKKVYLDHNFSGPFGLDFIYTFKNEFYLIDINPRINGVFSSLSNFFDFKYNTSLLCFLYSPFKDIKIINKIENILKKSINNFPFTRIYLNCEAKKDFKLKSSLKKGIYSIRYKKQKIYFEFIKKAESFFEIKNDNEIYIIPYLSSSYKKNNIVMIGDIFIKKSLEQKLSKFYQENLNHIILDSFIDKLNILRENINK